MNTVIKYIKYYDITGCILNIYTDENNGMAQNYLYAPDGVPIDILQKYEFVYDEHNKAYYKQITTDELSEVYRHMNPNRTYSYIGDKRFNTEKDRQLAYKLSWASLGLTVLPFIVGFLTFVSDVLVAGDIGNDTLAFKLLSIVSMITSICPVAGIVTLIIARFKDPNSRFVKVLTIIYTVLAVISILFIIIGAIACGLGMAACLDSLQSCTY